MFPNSFVDEDLDRVVQVMVLGGEVVNYTFDYDRGSGALAREEGFTADAAYRLEYEYQADTGMVTGVSARVIAPGTSGSKTLYFDLDYTYDEFGAVASVKYDDEFSVLYSRDALGRVTSVKRQRALADPQIDVVSNARYFPDGSLLRLEYANQGAPLLRTLYELPRESSGSYIALVG